MQNAQRQNSALYKFNRPANQLTTEQQALQEQVIQFCLANAHAEHATFLIQGAAGTGKSVILSSVFKVLQTLARQTPTSPLYGSQNVLLVNHPEMLKLYKSGTTTAPVLLKKKIFNAQRHSSIKRLKTTNLPISSSLMRHTYC